MNVFVNDTDNDDVCRFPITSLGLHFHNMVDTLKYFTKGPEFRLSRGVKKVRGAAQSSDKKSEESYHPLSSIIHRGTVMFYARCAAVWKANGYLPLCDSGRITKQ
jgi:hypothetical protein